MTITVGNLTFDSVTNHLDLIAKPIQKALEQWHGSIPTERFLVSEIDPAFSDSLAFCEKYNIPKQQGANCLIVAARRGGEVKHSACLVPINTRANLNTVVRKYLNARQVSLAPKDFAISASGMEYGSITIIGLPKEWQLLIDAQLVQRQYILVGGGLRRSKLLIPGDALSELSNTSIIPHLSLSLN